MTEEQKPTEETPQVVAPPVENNERVVSTPEEIQEGKTFAILSYALSLIGLPFFLAPLIMRNNTFSLYHAKQCLMIWIGAVAVTVVGSILSLICIGVVLLIAGFIFLLVLDVIGLMNAVKGIEKPLPLIGAWGEEWFKGLKKQPC